MIRPPNPYAPILGALKEVRRLLREISTKVNAAIAGLDVIIAIAEASEAEEDKE